MVRRLWIVGVLGPVTLSSLARHSALQPCQSKRGTSEDFWLQSPPRIPSSSTLPRF